MITITLARMLGSLHYMKGFDLFISASLNPEIGKEWSWYENVIQDLFPFHIRNLDKTFTDVPCVWELLPME